MTYDWPGNIRQFENAIEHAVAMSGGDSDDQPSALPEEVRERRRQRVVADGARFPTRGSTSRRSSRSSSAI